LEVKGIQEKGGRFSHSTDNGASAFTPSVDAEGLGLRDVHKISVIVTVHNEGAHIHNNLREFVKTLSGLNFDYEVILVDDGSTDNTYEEICRSSFDCIRVFRYSGNHGKGHALRYGAKHAAGELVAFIDGDLDLHPRQISTLIEYMDKDGSDAVIGSKRHPLSKVDYPLKRRILSRCYQIFVRFLFGLNLTDTQTGLKLFRREVLEKALPLVLVKEYAFDLELLVVADHLGYRITEAPVEINYHFNSNLNWRSVWRIFVDTCAIFYRLKILRYYDMVASRNSGL
jgi:glycosyltransferase involved in cell wall biosynthesis